tara:strand:- start:71 stop:217 length:147 start_codon:yes stop_codon:yes gene_type:complete
VTGWLAVLLVLGLISWLGWSSVEFDQQILGLRMVKRRRRRARRRKHHH